MRVFMFFINAIYWMWLFIVPTGLLGFIALMLYKAATDYLFLSIIISALGLFLGFQLAEHVRKKYGLDTFFGRLLSTPELEENDGGSKRNTE